MPGISGCVGCPSGNPSWLGMSITSGIQTEGNLFPLMPNGDCIGSEGSSAYLGQTKGFFKKKFGRRHVEGNPHNAPLIRLHLSDRESGRLS